MISLCVLLTILLFTLQTVSMKFIHTDTPRHKLLINTCFTGLISISTLIYSFIHPSPGDTKLLSYLLAILFGALFTLTIIFYYSALMKGPLAFTAFFFSASMLIPALCGLFFFDEPIKLSILIGIFTLLIAFYFINNASTSPNTSIQRSWPLYCFLTFLCNGLLGAIQKTHQYLMPSSDPITFITISFSTAFILYLFSYLLLCLTSKHPLYPTEELSVITSHILPIFLLALTSGIGNILLTYLAGQLPSSFLFPFVQGSIILTISFTSVSIFKEKLSLSGKIGITFGIMAIVILNL